jgi:hypothetical protein
VERKQIDLAGLEPQRSTDGVDPVGAGSNISADEASAFTRELSKSGQYAVTGEGRPFVGATSLRYFYDEDQSAAEQLARDAADALRKLNIPDRTISLVPLTGRALKPPRGTFELWLNLQSR